MCASKIFTELVVLMAFSNVDFSVRVTPAVKFPVPAVLRSSLKGEIVRFLILFPFLSGNGTRSKGETGVFRGSLSAEAGL
jgi:hypothetical protein